MLFREWFVKNAIFIESQKISQYIKQHGLQDDRDYIKTLPSVHHWLEKIAIKHPIPYKVGKTGLWLRGKNYYPVQVADAQELTVALKRTDGKDWSELHHLWPIFNDPGTNQEIIIPKTKAILVDSKEYLRFLDWLTYVYDTNKPDNPDEFFDNLLTKNAKTLDRIFSNKGSEFTTTDFDINSLKNVEGVEEKRQIKASRSNKPGGQGRTVVEFPNGWKWLSLDRGYCQEEGNAAGHCGNANPRPGENILSLRDQDNHIHMTVVVDKNGYTNEMKAPGNRKPRPYTHPYVVELLKKLNLNVGHGKWMQENDFKMTDLHPELAYNLHKDRPDLVKNSSQIQFFALQAQGNQDKFRELIEQNYGVKFPYSYDYPEQAILLDQGHLETLAQRYNIQNTQGQVLTNRNVAYEPSSYERPSMAIYMIGNAWNDLRTDVKNGIKQAYKIIPKEGEDEKELVINTLKSLYKTDVNVKKVIGNLYQEVSKDMHTTANNANSRGVAQEEGDGFYIKFIPRDRLQILLHPRYAEQMLEQKEEIKVPEGMQFGIFSPPDYSSVGDENKQEWEIALVHALDKTRFWERPVLTQKGQDWQQSVEDIPGLKEKEKAQRDMPKLGEHPMQKQVRMEYIRRELDQRMMTGGYDEFVKELKAKGWWNEYIAWLKQQGLASGYGF